MKNNLTRFSLPLALVIAAVVVILLTAIPAQSRPPLGITNFDSIHLRDTGPTAQPVLRVDQRGVGKVVEFMDAGTPVFSILDGGSIVANSILTQAATINNLVVSAPTAIGTATPAAYINSAGVSNLLEVADATTPVIQAFNNGGVRVAAPTAVATTIPALYVDTAGVSNAFEVRKNATPIFSVAGDGTNTLATGSISAGEVADVVRSIPIPLGSFIDCQTDAGALLGFDTTADALADYVNSATDGTGRVIRFDDTGGTEDQSMEICAELSIPADYISGGAFMVRALKDAHTAATEVINCAVSVNGGALETAGTVTTTASATTNYTCTPTIAALAVNDSLSFYLSITSDGTMNDGVDIAAVRFFYTAAQ